MRDVRGILSLARSSGIDTLDTAIAYGSSEACIGQVGVEEFKVITKLPSLPENIIDVRHWVHDEIQASLQRLNVDTVYAVLLHHPHQLLGSKGKLLYEALMQLKTEGVAQKVGVSIYNPSELDSVMSMFMVDLVQAPFNLIDQRLQSSGWLQKLDDSGVEVHARSAFLQGLLLMPTIAIPEKFKHWLPLFDSWHDWLDDNNISAVHACMGFVRSYSQIAKIVVGVESATQLEELIQAEKLSPMKNWPDISSVDESLINPSYWNKL